MAIPHRVKVLEKTRVGPPKGSVAEASLSLTFFDVLRLQAPPVQLLFFYEFSQPNTTTAHFLNLLLSDLKLSLSLALQLFYPLAGTLSLSPVSGDHEIRYIEGDSVQLTVAESDSDFQKLSDDLPKDMALLQTLLPDSPASDSDLLSLQLTVFPNSGICLGISVHHAAADGSSTMQFVKHWASISRLRPGCDEPSSMIAPAPAPAPVFERACIPEPHGLKRTFLEQMEKQKKKLVKECWGVRARPDTVVAAFVLGRARIEMLRQKVAMARPYVNGEKLPNYSPFTLACAHVWVCLVRARGDCSDKTAHFKFDSGCRGKTCTHPPIPVTYFGNCIRPCFVRAERGDLARENGIWVACEAIWRAIQGLGLNDEDDGVAMLEEAEGWIPRLKSIESSREQLVWLSWSPKIGVYDADFGMGRPSKVEVMSMELEEKGGAMSLTESRDGGEGGLEVGLALPRPEMEGFAALFEEGLKLL